MTAKNRLEVRKGGYRSRCRGCFNASRKTGHPPGRPKKDELRTDLPPLEEHRLQKRLREAERKQSQLLVELSSATYMQDLAREVEEANAKVKPILPRERKSTLREATALVLGSDWHVEEEVRPEQVAGRNRYNLAISEKRMTRFFEAARWATDFNRQAFLMRTMLLWLGGDFITGFLHDDNKETNLLHPVQAIAYAQRGITDGIRYLLQDPLLEELVIVCNDGNHGRLTRETRSSSRTANSIEWLMYTNLAREFRDEPRVKFIIAQGEHVYHEVFGRTIRFTHGDTVRYAGGVGGVTIPLYKAIARWDTVRRADHTCVGHFHQLTHARRLTINGSLIGYSPYALTVGAEFEPPAQSYQVLDSRRFNSVNMPLWVSNPEDDGAR